MLEQLAVQPEHDPLAIFSQLYEQLIHFSLQEPPHVALQFPVQTPEHEPLHSPEQEEEQFPPQEPEHEELHEEHPDEVELSLQVPEQVVLHEELQEEHPDEEELPLQLPEQAELQVDEHELHPESSKSSSLSQLKNTEGIVKHARIGSVFFAPLLKNSRLLRSSSLEILSAIYRVFVLLSNIFLVIPYKISLIWLDA